MHLVKQICQKQMAWIGGKNNRFDLSPPPGPSFKEGETVANVPGALRALTVKHKRENVCYSVVVKRIQSRSQTRA